MINREQVQRLVAAVPGATDESDDDRLVFSCGERGFAWTFMQRDAAKKPRRPNLAVLAISCSLEQKEFLIEAAPHIYFDDDHYRGYPAVLTRLAVIDAAELMERLQAAFAFQAARPPKKPRKR